MKNIKILVILVVLATAAFFLGRALSPYLSAEKEKPAIGIKVDYDSLIKAVKEGKTAKINTSGTINMFGMLVSSKGSYKVEKIGPGKVKLYVVVKEVNVKFSDEMKKMMLDKGTTKKEILKAEQKATKSAQRGVGKGTCIFDKNVLLGLLKKWKSGSFSSNDWELAEKREGAIFEQQVQPAK